MSDSASHVPAAAAAPAAAPGSKGYIFFDLDNTLYSFAKTNIDKKMSSNIIDYVTKFCGMSPEDAISKTNQYYAEYGLTIAGLVRHHHVDPEHYCRYVHNVGVDEVIERDVALVEMMRSLQADGWNLWVLTNAVMGFALDVLKKLGVYDFFVDGEELKVLDCFAQWEQGRGDAVALQTAKPSCSSYEFAMRRSGATPADVMVMVEDSLANLKVPQRLGWVPVWIGYGKELPDPANQEYHVLNEVHALPTLLHNVAAVKVTA
jgi:pyrimidine 5'-nucleotidase